MIRDLNLNDLVILEKDAKFPLPNLNSPLYIIKKSILGDELLGSFWVKLTTETSLVFRPELSQLEKARAIKEIFNFLYREIQKHGLDDSHLFIEENGHFVDVMKKHYNFKDNLGTALYIRKEDSHG